MTKKYLEIKSWDIFVNWSDGEKELIHEVPDHIIRDLNYYFDLLEEQRNETKEDE